MCSASSGGQTWWACRACCWLSGRTAAGPRRHRHWGWTCWCRSSAGEPAQAPESPVSQVCIDCFSKQPVEGPKETVPASAARHHWAGPVMPRLGIQRAERSKAARHATNTATCSCKAGRAAIRGQASLVEGQNLLGPLWHWGNGSARGTQRHPHIAIVGGPSGAPRVLLALQCRRMLSEGA